MLNLRYNVLDCSVFEISLVIHNREAEHDLRMLSHELKRFTASFCTQSHQAFYLYFGGVTDCSASL